MKDNVMKGWMLKNIMKDTLCVSQSQKLGEFNPAGKPNAGFGLTVKQQSQMFQKRHQA